MTVCDLDTLQHLRALQQSFQAYLRHGDNQIAAVLQSTGRLDKTQSMRVYYDGYRLRLKAILQADYVQTQRIMGAARFDQAVNTYLAAYPSQTKLGNCFGAQFYQCLQTVYPECPHFAEVAALEWHWGDSPMAAPAPVATLADWADLPPEIWGRVRFITPPALRTVACHGNSLELWQAACAGAQLPEVVVSEPMLVVVWCVSGEPRYLALQSLGRTLMQALLAGQTFAALCVLGTEVLSDSDTGAATTAVAGLLGQWLQSGMISHLEVT